MDKKFESLRDKMKGKDTEDIINQVKGKSPSYKLEKAIEYNLYDLAKIAIEEGAIDFSDELIINNIDNMDAKILNLIVKDSSIIHLMIVLVKQRKARYEFAKYLKGIGLDIEPERYSDLSPSFLDSYDSFLIHDFTSSHRNFLIKKHGVRAANITDEMWDDSMSDIRTNLEKILSNNELHLKDSLPILFGGGNLLVKLAKPKVTETDKEIMDIFKEGVHDDESVFDIIIDYL